MRSAGVRDQMSPCGRVGWGKIVWATVRFPSSNMALQATGDSVVSLAICRVPPLSPAPERER